MCLSLDYILPRGVYCLPVYDENGYRFLAAVDDAGRVVQKRRLFSLAEVATQTAMLRRWLDAEYPNATETER